MSCSKIRKHLEAAEEEIRHALTASLENKHEENLTLLVDTLNNVKELLVTTPIRGTDNTHEYYKKNAEHNFKLESPYLDSNVINFPTSIPGMDIDTSNLSYTQIDKINHCIDTFDTSRNKINVMRILMRNGIQTFNVDRLFLSTSYIQ